MNAIKAKSVRDPLYGYIEFNEIERMVIDNLFFQRLRRIAQTQQTHLVYPTITHSRFAHSLGVMYLMGVSFDKLYPKLQRAIKESILQKETIKNVLRTGLRVGALLHDVGHMTFSHWFEELLDKWHASPDFKMSLNFRNHEELGYYLSKYVILKRLNLSLAERKNFLSHVREEDKVEPNILCFIAESMLYPPSMLKNKVEEKNEIAGAFSFKNLVKGYISVIESISKDWRISDDNILPAIKKILFPFYQLLHCWIFTIDELDYLSRDNLFAGTEFGQIDWLRLINHLSVSCGKNESGEFAYLTISDLRKIIHNLKLFYTSYFNSYLYLYGHSVVKYFDYLATSLAQNLRTLEDSFKMTFKEVGELLYKISELSPQDSFYEVIFKIYEIKLFTELSNLVDAVFLQDLISQYIPEFEKLLKLLGARGEDLEREVVEKKRLLSDMYEYLSRGPTSFKILHRVVAYPKNLESIQKDDVKREMDEEWNYVIDKLRKYLEELRLREREHFLIYNWGFISPKGIKFCPLDTPITNETTFGDFLSFIQANELFVYIAYLFLIKTIDEKRRPALMELKRELDESSKHLKLKLEY